ncbi:MAG: D-glucuronyl C5-epimerase family protein [Clostridium sp.]
MSKKNFKKKSKVNLILISVIVILVILSITIGKLFFNNKNKSIYGDKYLNLVEEGLNRFPTEARNFKLFLQDYNEFGDYLNYGKNKDIMFNFPALKMNLEQLPMVKYGEEYYYNPVTLAQYGLAVYGEYLDNKATKEEFLRVVDKLLTLQDENGAFLYNFSWRYYLNDKDYEPGWVSGMAQGQALSVLARAYHITNDEKYIIAGEKTLNYMVTDVEDGGVKTNLGYIDDKLKNNIIFEEYISDIPSYTLNGFMFSILGLYDWSKIENETATKLEAEVYFKESIDSLKKILKYYDIGGFTAYDLGHLTREDRQPHIAPNYHGVHIYLLNALYSITNDAELLKYKELWESYVSDIF